MKRFAKLAAVGLAGLGLLTMNSSPAQAVNGAIAFVGSAEVNPGLGYPLPGSTGSCATWSFDFGIAVGVSDTPNVGTVTGGAAGELCEGLVQDLLAEHVDALDYIDSGGFCGLSGVDEDDTHGTGDLVLDGVFGTESLDLVDIHWHQSLATVIVFDGDALIDHDNNNSTAGINNGDEVYGVVSAVPTTGSCASGTATGFTIVGASVVEDNIGIL